MKKKSSTGLSQKWYWELKMCAHFSKWNGELQISCSSAGVPLNTSAMIYCLCVTAFIHVTWYLRPCTLLHNCKVMSRQHKTRMRNKSRLGFFFSSRIICLLVTFSNRAFGGFTVMWFIWACGTLMMPGSLACIHIHEQLCLRSCGDGRRDHHTSAKSLPSKKSGWWSFRGSYARRHRHTCPSRQVTFP